MSRPISLVTGGAGFIGSHMVDLLLSLGHEVRVVDDLSGGRISNLEAHKTNTNLIFEEKDILDIKSDDPFYSGVDYVFHFAGIGDIVPSIEDPSRYMQVNVQGTVNVLEAVREGGIKRFVYSASSSCYGLAETPTNEEHDICPQYPYALSKFQGEQAVLHWAKVYGLPINSICIFNAYGPRSRTSGAYGAVLGVFLKQKLAGRPLTVVGDGTQSRDFIFVTDVARAFWAVAKCSVTGERFNIGCGCPQSINKLVDLLDGEVEYIPWRPGEPSITYADITKITTITNWRPLVSFEEGVKTILRNIDYWHEAPLWTSENIEEATSTWHKFMG